MTAVRTVALALTLLAAPSLAASQQYAPIALGVDATTVEVSRDVATAQRLAGPVLGANLSASFRRLHLEGRYAEGTLTPEGSPSSAREEFVDARLIARARLLPWLSVGAGPHLRAYVTPANTARWSRVELHSRVESELIAGLAQLRIDLWYAVGADVNVQDGGDGAVGGEAGLTIRVPRTPTAVQISYTADRARFTNGGTELVEGVRVALVLDRILRPLTAQRRAGSPVVPRPTNE